MLFIPEWQNSEAKLICVANQSSWNWLEASNFPSWSQLASRTFYSSTQESLLCFVMASNFSPQHRFLIAAWYEVYHSPVVVQRLYRCRFGSNASVPSAKSIKAIHHRTSVDGILTDRPRSGRPVTASKPENVQLVMNTFTAHPTTSTRIASRQLHLSRSTVQRKIHQHELHPYRLRQLQELSPEDCANRCHAVCWRFWSGLYWEQLFC